MPEPAPNAIRALGFAVLVVCAVAGVLVAEVTVAIYF
jgi:hypothetical protein